MRAQPGTYLHYVSGFPCPSCDTAIVSHRAEGGFRVQYFTEGRPVEDVTFSENGMQHSFNDGNYRPTYPKHVALPEGV